MCFSPSASFTAAVLLGTLGYACLKETKNPKEGLLASIPLFFAVQQAAEGVVWMTIPGSETTISLATLLQTPLLTASTHVFLFFAYLFWPLWIPLSFLAVEKVQFRTKILATTLIAGMIFGGASLGYLFYTGGLIDLAIKGHSLHYELFKTLPQLLCDIFKLLYLYAVLAPSLVSSMKRAWIFGLLIAATFALSEYLYTVAFVSVWCFFSAIASASIYVILRQRQTN